MAILLTSLLASAGFYLAQKGGNIIQKDMEHIRDFIISREHSIMGSELGLGIGR